MTTTHTCDNKCSWKQSADDLRALGFEIRSLRSDDPPMKKAEYQNLVSEARYEAAVRGLIRTCTKTDRVWDHKKNKPKV